MTHYSTTSKIYNIRSDSKDAHFDTSSKNTNTVSLNSNNDDSNSLPGLLAHYNSDSEQEEVIEKHTGKLDEKVDDFLEEINKLTPACNKKGDGDILSEAKTEPVSTWQECYDDSSGYPYYWNIQTNEVTWEMPLAYKNWLDLNAQSTKEKNDQKVKKKEKLQPCVTHEQNKGLPKKTAHGPPASFNNKLKSKKKPRSPVYNSDDEKIVLITSFCETSSSDSDSDKNDTSKKTDDPTEMESKTTLVMGPQLEHDSKKVENIEPMVEPAIIVENVKDENIDETVILSRLRTQAKVLQELGGELPKSVDRLVLENEVVGARAPSLSLVAGYGDDTDDDESPVKPETGAATLFPIVKPLDIHQFDVAGSQSLKSSDGNDIISNTSSIVASTTTTTTITTSTTSTGAAVLVDNKVFKRKKRLDVSFGAPPLKPDKKLKLDNEPLQFDEERKGFGFQSETSEPSNVDDKVEKVPFVKGGIAFVKADVLRPATMGDPKQTTMTAPTSDEPSENTHDFDNTKEIVSEKVRFLSEGKEPVAGVQAMLIQLQTLEAAFKAGGLSLNYFWCWLRETFHELAKLEDDAAPAGWHCHWDRLNKRYFYRNQQTGETQWQYPDPDIVGGAEAMDISTTPPPSTDELEPTSAAPPSVAASSLSSSRSETPPPPPSPSPPPPPPPPTPPPPPPPPPPPASAPSPSPIIGNVVVDSSTQQSPDQIESHMSPVCNSPVPQAVQSPDVSTDGTTQPSNDALVSELDSFYSDIALLEAAATPALESVKNEPVAVPETIVALQSTNPTTDTHSADHVLFKKKKKSKQKIGQRLDMKKKAVSSLVEKWKKVQNDYL